MNAETDCQTEYDYVIVGSGAGGATVAARLAERGHTVLVLEAGGDPLARHPETDSRDRLPADYRVPMFHLLASENPRLTWDYYVRNYASNDSSRRNPRYVDERDGVLYPRGSALGGGTAHDAMTMIRPYRQYWDQTAKAIGDSTWSAKHMQAYFERIEDCGYRPFWQFLAKLGLNPTRHGFGGWLRTERAIPLASLEDRNLAELVAHSVKETQLLKGQLGHRLRKTILGQLDPNDCRVSDEEGLVFLPLSTKNHSRNGARERLLTVAQQFPGRLTIQLYSLATRIVLDDGNRATGVEYLKGERLFRAHKRPNMKERDLRRAIARREVIVCAGAFNSPHLLKLSGIGPRRELEAHGIDVRVDLPGVGSNLQDCYEVGVAYRMNFDEWDILHGAHYEPGDHWYKAWKARRAGLYTSNGGVLSLLKRSDAARTFPDLACTALLGYFQGYYPGFARDFACRRNYLTWLIRKTPSANTAGVVELRSSDPLDPPNVTFHYFEEGNDIDGIDIQSLTKGVRLVRKLMLPLQSRGLVAEEERPGPSFESDEEITDYIRFNAWGREASCTCAIGDPASGGVVSSSFEVHGARRLRVVDSSVFPRTPSPFMSAAIYMIGEKAADAISEVASERG